MDFLPVNLKEAGVAGVRRHLFQPERLITQRSQPFFPSGVGLQVGPRRTLCKDNAGKCGEEEALQRPHAHSIVFDFRNTNDQKRNAASQVNQVNQENRTECFLDSRRISPDRGFTMAFGSVSFSPLS